MSKSKRWLSGNNEHGETCEVVSWKWKVGSGKCFQRQTAKCLPLIALFKRLLTTLFLLLSSDFPLSFADEVWPQLETQHFLVIAEPTAQPQSESLADWDKILRQYIEQLDTTIAPLMGAKRLSQVQPLLGQKPILMLCADKSSYLKRLGEYGVVNPATAVGSGGYYHPNANVIFTWRQPTDYYARHVVLHEVAHWYCRQLLGSRYGKMPLWLCEGLADHAAFHTWDGHTLQSMRLPRVSLENYPARLDALLKPRLQASRENFAHHFQSPESEVISPESISRFISSLRAESNVSTGDTIYDQYALAWGLVASLVEKYPREMTHFFESLHYHDVSVSWILAFEDDRHQPTWHQLGDWVGAHQLSWQWVWNHWEDTGIQLLGISDTTALIVQNRMSNPQKSDNTNDESDVLLRCEVTPLLERTIIGLVFRFESKDRFEMLQFRHVGCNTAEWRHVRYAHNQWELLTAWAQTSDGGLQENDSTVSPDAQSAVLEVRQVPSIGGLTLRFFYNGHTVTESANTFDSDLPFGLAVQSGAALFSDLSIGY